MQAPRGGLARYRSAPASWLETLLESDEEQPQTHTQAHKHSEVVLEIPEPPLPTSTAGDEDDDGDIDLELLGVGSGGLSNFLRQNSSPAEFLSLINGSGADSEGYFGNLGYRAGYDSVSPLGKRAREAEDWDKVSPKMSPLSSTSGSAAAAALKREKSSELPGGIGRPLNAEMEKLFEDSVMCRVRAKRGCATHPRSIAERVRRTRISDRIRKLQELVPNMDKSFRHKLLREAETRYMDFDHQQTNTADMLDEAVAYVKFLQQQIREITEQQKNCKCSPNK